MRHPNRELPLCRQKALDVLAVEFPTIIVDDDEGPGLDKRRRETTHPAAYAALLGRDVDGHLPVERCPQQHGGPLPVWLSLASTISIGTEPLIKPPKLEQA